MNNGRVEVQNRGYGRQMGGGQGFNAMGRNNNRAQVVEQGNAQNGLNGLRCYNCNEKGHLANACPKPRTRGSAYFK